MAHQLVKPYSFLMYFLAIIAFFFLGIVYAGIIEAGKGQMLAGGAIVLGYGVMGAFIGLCVSLFTAYKARRGLIIKINGLLALVIVASFAYFTIKYQKRQKEKEEQKTERTKPKKPTAPAAEAQQTKPIAMLTNAGLEMDSETDMGLGMFSPNIDENTTLYFYHNPHLDKTIDDHIPYDSITFKKLEFGGFDIATAPSWLVPEHLKLDYNILFFKVQSISQEYIEVTVNATNNQTSFVNRYSGKLHYWPEFLLSVNNVEFTNPKEETIFVKPLDYAGSVNVKYSFMKPQRVTHSWMYVELVDNNYNAVGKGWIKWKRNEKLLIEYSLLS